MGLDIKQLRALQNRSFEAANTLQSKPTQSPQVGKFLARNTLRMSMLASVFVAYGALRVYTGPVPAFFDSMLNRSVVTEACSVGWQSRSVNIDELHCVMTRQVERLCDGNEKLALIAAILRFERDLARNAQQENALALVQTQDLSNAGDFMQQVQEIQRQGMQAALAHAKYAKMMNTPGISQEELQAAEAQIFEATGEANALLTDKDAKSKFTPDNLTNAARALIASGYLKVDDLPLPRPAWWPTGTGALALRASSC